MSSVVQTASGSTTSSSLTLTFPSALTWSNSVVIALAGYPGGSVSGITLGATAGTFSKQAGAATGNAEIWANLSIGSVGVTTVTITTSTAGIIANAYEVLGALNSTSSATLTLDKTTAQTGVSTAWNSGSTGSTFNAQQEFVIGVGGINNAGTITGPTSGGWTNSAATTIATPFGAVSGYKFSTGSNVISYAGTAASSGTWASCAATFICAGRQPGWGGISFTEHSSYTGISASFTVPSVSSAGECSIWVGLGNVYQTGIFLSYDTAFPGNGATGAWTWVLSGAGELWDSTHYPVSVGHNLTLAITLSNKAWVFAITNNTAGWTYAETKSVESTNVGATGWVYPVTEAEVIIEKEGAYDNPNYGSVAFTNVTTTPAVVGAPAPIVTVNSAVDQYPGPFSGSGFTMYWNAAS